jgi:hypothetical protein
LIILNWDGIKFYLKFDDFLEGLRESHLNNSLFILFACSWGGTL